MILNTYLKTQKITLTKNQKSSLGKSIVRCFVSKYPNAEIKKVSILESDFKMEVIDYPKEFLQSDSVNKIIKRFLKKMF